MEEVLQENLEKIANNANTTTHIQRNTRCSSCFALTEKGSQLYVEKSSKSLVI